MEFTPGTPSSAETSVKVSQATFTPVPAPVDNITKVVHQNARHKLAPKKKVVIQTCEICNIELKGQVVIDAHMNGNKHLKKLKAQQLLSNLIGAGQVNVPNDKSALFRCEPCNVSLNSSQQLEVHNAGAKHKANLNKGTEESAQGSKGNEPKSGSLDESSQVASSSTSDKVKPLVANPLDLVCTVCDITVNSPQQLEQHLNSKKHQDREAGRKLPPQRAGPYSRPNRGMRGGLGSHGRSKKGTPGKFASLSSSFTSAGYSNSFIKPEGGVIMPQNCATNKGPNHSSAPQQNANKGPNFGGQFKNRGNFGSLTPYINTDSGSGRGGFNAHGGAPARGGWSGYAPDYAAQAGYSGYNYEQYGYNYSGYENTDGYGGYGMMQPGPPPTY